MKSKSWLVLVVMMVLLIMAVPVLGQDMATNTSAVVSTDVMVTAVQPVVPTPAMEPTQAGNGEQPTDEPTSEERVYTLIERVVTALSTVAIGAAAFLGLGGIVIVAQFGRFVPVILNLLSGVAAITPSPKDDDAVKGAGNALGYKRIVLAADTVLPDGTKLPNATIIWLPGDDTATGVIGAGEVG